MHRQSVRRLGLGLSLRTESVIRKSITTESATVSRSPVNMRSPAGNVRANVQYLDSEYHNAWIEHASHAILDGTYFGTPAFDPRGRIFVRWLERADLRHRTAC